CVRHEAGHDLDDHHRGSDNDHDARTPFRVRKIRHEIVSLTETGMINPVHQMKLSRSENFSSKIVSECSVETTHLTELWCVPQCYCESCIAPERARQCCHNATNEIKISIAPNVQTIAAPDGRSQQKERNRPAIPPTHAMIHPMSNRRLILVARLIPQTAGTIR